MASLLERYARACAFTQRVDAPRVASCLQAFFDGLGVRVSMRQLGSFKAAWTARAAGAARAARAAGAAWDARSARAAWAAGAAGVAGSARSARAAWTARAAGAARAARAARAAETVWSEGTSWSSWVARAAGTVWSEGTSCSSWDARTIWATWDASWESLHCVGFEALHDVENLAKWMTYFEAFESGMWCSFHLDDEVLWVPIPSVLHCNARNHLHCEGAPALQLPDEAWYFLNGVRMEEWMVMTPAEQLDPRRLLSVANSEQRRELLRKVGLERFVQAVGATTLDQEGDYTLLAIDFNGKSRPYLKMRNPSLGIWHVEGVPPGTQTVAEALRARQPAALRALPVDEAQGAEWYQQGDVYIWPRDAVAVKARPALLT